jgi:hypothetical protein
LDIGAHFLADILHFSANTFGFVAHAVIVLYDAEFGTVQGKRRPSTANYAGGRPRRALATALSKNNTTNTMNSTCATPANSKAKPP